MPSPATFTSTSAALTDRQTACTTSTSPNTTTTTTTTEGRTSLSSNRSRFNSLSSKATSSEDNLFSSSFESNTSSFLDTTDQRLDETTIQVYYDSAESTSPSASSSSSTQTLKATDEKRQKVEIVVDEDLSASDLCDNLTIKLSLKGKHHLVAQIPSLNIQRVIDDDEEVLPLTVSGSMGRFCSCESDPSGRSITSPSGKPCHRHRRSSSLRRQSDRSSMSQKQGQKVETGKSTVQSEEQDPSVKQGQDVVRDGHDVRILLQKTTSSKYGFMDRPQDFMSLNMVEFNSPTGEKSASHERVVTEPSEKIVLMQEMIRFGRDVPPITVSAPVTYNGRQVTAEVSLSGRNFQDFFLLRCRSGKEGVKQEADVALFLSALYDVFIPIHDDDDARDEDVVACSTDTTTGAKEGRESPSFRFALCRTGDSEPEPVHWFSCESEEQRTTFLTCMTMVKFGLKSLRQKAKLHAKHFPPVFDIIPPASYNDPSHQSTYSGMDSTTGDASSIKSWNASRGPSGRRSRDESVSLMLKKHSPEYEPWFYPDMSREEATTSLSKYCSVDGVFLVRASQRTVGAFVLSFIASGKVNHVTIQNVDADHGQVVVSLDWGVTKFYDLKQLIEFYQLNQGSLPTRLTHFLVHK